jgi:hypothetical protein
MCSLDDIIYIPVLPQCFPLSTSVRLVCYGREDRAEQRLPSAIDASYGGGLRRTQEETVADQSQLSDRSLPVPTATCIYRVLHAEGEGVS